MVVQTEFQQEVNGNGKPPHSTQGNICPYQHENEGFWDWMMVVTCRRALEKQMVLKLTEDVIGDIYIIFLNLENYQKLIMF